MLQHFPSVSRFVHISAVVYSGERLPPSERGVLEEACNAALTELILVLRPSIVIGVGNFAGTKCIEVYACVN